jgi:asparagine synthase (glutamine-hydrolysing)
MLPMIQDVQADLPIERRKITIHGHAVMDRRLLTSAATVFDGLRTIQDYARFAARLRGQFCITIESGCETFAITDFGGSRPVFYLWDQKQACYRVSPRLSELLPSNGEINKHELFSYVTRAGIGIEPVRGDVKGVFPATVARFCGSQIDLVPYLDWQDFLEEIPTNPGDAEDRFIHIAGDYMNAVLGDDARVGCLLSGGTDSAIVAWLLRSIGKNVVCMTADYDWKRYSEYPSASRNARSLGLLHERIQISRGNHRDGFRELNSQFQNAPCCHSQSPSLYQMAKRAREQGIKTLVTGDHADALFLGFDRFSSGLPHDPAGYAKNTVAFDPTQKIDRLYTRAALSPDQADLLSALGYSTRECIEWQEMLYVGDRERMESCAERAPLSTLQQLNGQIWAGISWQNIFLPVAQAFQDEIEFVSPFYDLEMVKFALSLPLEYKFRNGATKILLRRILQRILKIDIPKRASPNPSRVWSLMPNLDERGLQPPFLRPLYDRMFLKNAAFFGKYCHQLDKISALGIWLRGQQLYPPVASKLR